MSDPYNTAPTPVRAGDETASVPPVTRPATRAPRRTVKPAAQSERSALVPTLNVIAVITILIWAEMRSGGLKAGSFFVVCGPMLLAIVTSLWISNRTFTTIVRWLNAFMAAWILLRLMRYVSSGLFSMNMVVLFLLSVAVPAFNAFYLKPKPVE